MRVGLAHFRACESQVKERWICPRNQWANVSQCVTYDACTPQFNRTNGEGPKSPTGRREICNVGIPLSMFVLKAVVVNYDVVFISILNDGT